MSNSLKIGIISGSIAGIIAGIIHTVFLNLAISIGFFIPATQSIILTRAHYVVNIPISIIFGFICGAIYSRAYSVIPGKGISKGVFYGFILLLLSWVQNSSFLTGYGRHLDVLGYIFSGFFQWMTYGLILGILYEYLHSRYYPTKKELKIITYAVIGGVFPGAFAGIADGIAAALANAIASMIGLLGPQVMAGVPNIFTFDFWVYQSGTHILVNLIWGIVIGMIFTQVYNLVPGKGIIKGLYYSLIIALLSTYHFVVYGIGWGLFSFALWASLVGLLSTATTLGIVLGLLYRKPKK